MGRALATSMRRQIVQQHLQGHSLAAIARLHQLSYSTVRNCWQRYRRDGFDSLAPDYANCGRDGPTERDLLYRAARYLKFLHRPWGAPLIRLKLQQRYSERYGEGAIPVYARFSAGSRRQGAPLRKRRPGPKKRWATAVHEVWQLDAKERITLESGEHACYLTMVDEHSGALLEAPVFPPRLDQSSSAQVRDHLIASFKRWGLPASIKVDNGHPFGDPQRKAIPVLALWLISLGVDVIWNRPRQPTDNAKVERMQGTSKR